jgi:hypothetical protein
MRLLCSVAWYILVYAYIQTFLAATVMLMIEAADSYK